jgi:3-deoxy-manno-octulosonate cytidylyltransferase (CMP-KDO synthetase)
MIIVPARLASSRLPRKVLADIGGTPMVVKTAQAVSQLDEVVIATDSKEVAEVVESYGFKAVMTSNSCNSGTDRVYEAGKKLNLKDDEIIINLQADEPFIEIGVVKKLIDLTKEMANNSQVIATSCYKIINQEEANEPSIVKVVTDRDNFALYFSRSLIPFSRDNKLTEYKGHLGLYGFTMAKLREFCNMNSSELESIEKLEQLRVLESGRKIALVEVESNSFGIDTQDDLIKARDLVI